MADDVSVTFGATIEKLLRGMKDAQGALEKFAEPFEKIVSFAGEAGEAIAGAFAVEKIVEFIEKMGELGLRTERTMAQLGLSAQAAGELSGIAQLTGTSLEGMTTAIERLSLGVQKSTADGFSPQAQALKVLGLNAKELIGIPADQYFDRLAGAVSKFNPSLNLTNALMQLGGRGVTQLIPMLQRGTEGFNELRHEIEATGAILDDKQTARFAQVHEKMTLLGMAAKGVAIALFDDLRPAFEGVIRSLTEFLEAITKSVKEGGTMAKLFDTLGFAAKIAASAIVGVVATIRGLGEAVVAIVQLTAGDVEKFKSYAEEASKEFEKIGADLKKTLIEIWKTPIDVHGRTRAEAAALDEAAHQRLQADLKRIDEEIKIEQEGLKRKTLLLDGEVQVHQMTQNAKFAALMKYTDASYEEELRLLQREEVLTRGQVVMHQDVLNKITQLKAKHNTDMIRLDQQSIQAQQQIYGNFFSTIQGAFNAQLRGLLAGTVTFQQAFKNILGDLLIKFIEFCEKTVLEWVAAQIAKTTASQTGAAAQAAADVAGAEATLPARIAKFTSDITADAAAVFAGVFANLAPLMGPAAAGPATASSTTVLASLAAVPKFEVGTDLITRTGLALVHAGEKITPAQGSGPFTGGGAPTINVSYTANGRLMISEIKEHARTIAREVAAQFDMNPSLRPAH